MSLLKGWEEKELGEVCKINPSKKEVLGLPPNTELTILPMAAVSENGQILVKETKRLSDVKNGFPYFRENDIILAKITPCLENGKRAIATGLKNNIGFGSTEFHVIRAKNNVLTKWIYYIVSSAKFRKLAEENMTGTAGQKRVPTNFLKKYMVSVPPTPTQRKIVAILEKADAIKQKRKQIIEHSNKLSQSVFLEVFGDPGRNPNKWALKPIKDYVERTETRDPRSSQKKSFIYVDIASVDNKVKLIIEPKELLGVEAPSRARKVIREGDILVSTVRPNLNAVAIVPKELDNQICSTGFCVLSCKNSLERRYLFELTKSDYFVNHLVAKATGASYPAVSDSIIQNTPVPIPPIELQRKFALVSEKIAHATLMQTQSEEFSQELFNSLMQKAFTGELVR